MFHFCWVVYLVVAFLFVVAVVCCLKTQENVVCDSSNDCCAFLFVCLLVWMVSLRGLIVHCLSVCLPACLSVCLFVCLSVSLSLCFSVCLLVFPSVCLSICLSVCLSVWFSLSNNLCYSGFCVRALTAYSLNLQHRYKTETSTSKRQENRL